MTLLNLGCLLLQSGRSFPERPAVSVGDRLVWSYGDYAALSARLAGGLSRSLRPGQRVALCMSNNTDYLALLFAVWQAGLVAVPVNARLHAKEIAYILADSGAALCIASSDLAEVLARELTSRCRLLVFGDGDWRRLAAEEPVAPLEREAEDPAWIFYTSGTTGRPKGAVLTHRNLWAMTVAYLADVDYLTPEDALLHVSAQSHAAGLFGLSHLAKATHQILPPSGGFDPGELAQLLTLGRSMTLFVPPTGLRRLLYDPAFDNAPEENLRSLLLGAAPVYVADLKAAYERFGPRLWNGYGQGESPCTITALSKELMAAALDAGDEARLQSVGIARSGITLAVLDEAGRALPPGEVGEICVRGDTVMAGYWRQPEATAETLRGGWLHTGDLGMLDRHGFLTLLDRTRDLIISGGLNIYPREVEEVLLEDPGLAEVAVVGVPDAEWGESVLAVLVPVPGTTPDLAALERRCLERIARFKRPRHWQVAESLPKNAVGKVLKRVLRERFAPVDPVQEANLSL